MAITIHSSLPKPGDWQTVDDLFRLQLDRLPHAIEAARQSPFYRDRLPKRVTSYEELAGLPITTKEQMRGAYPFGMLAVPKRKLVTYHESSGTTGQPTASYFTENDWLDMTSRIARSRVGLGEADTLLVKTPYSLLITAHQIHRAAERQGAFVVPADNRSALMPYPKVIRLLRDLEVTVAWCMPTEALLWAEAARLAGFGAERDFPNFRAFFVAGEPLSAAKKKRIRKLWNGADVVEDYGSTETGSLGGEAPDGAMFLWADRFIFEVYDPETGRASREGRGQLLVTSLFREAIPLVRYNLEDEVELKYETTEQGWTLPRVKVFGRAHGRPCVQGKAFYPVELEEALYAASDSLLFWRARHDADTLEIEFESEDGRSRAEAEAMEAHVYDALGVKATVRPVGIGAIVARSSLREEGGFAKPRFLFGKDEDWKRAVLY